MQTITNIAAYKFASLQDLKPLRERLTGLCRGWNLKGTILLSTEGINLFVAGPRAQIDLLLEELKSIPGLESLEAKFSESDDQPFHRMLVKIKREIISFGIDGIDPVRRPAPKIAPAELKQWLDEGRPITLLDTRNTYEVKLGTFRDAKLLDIDHFRQFPEAVRGLPEEMKKQPIVMFCTGGIRCEKAGPFMEREGFEKIFQLEGGILKYFEECGAAHYDGDCFVFDHRVGVDPNLHESDTGLCFACQMPVSVEDQQDPRFVEGVSCPSCYVATEEQQQRERERHQAELKRLSHPLPGSQPYTNQRPLNVPSDCDGKTVLGFLTTILPQISSGEWVEICRDGRLRKRVRAGVRDLLNLENTAPVSPEDSVRAGDRFLHVEAAVVDPDVNADIRILHEDEAIIVVHKPAPLPMHPCGRFHRNTLLYMLGQVYQPQSPRPVHRLDANTTGIVVLARTRHFAKLLQRQFEIDTADAVEKRYLARVQGHPPEDQFSCRFPISQDPGEVGTRAVDFENGLAAHTEFRVIERHADGTSLLDVVPHTGRTNQIRVHLWHLGFPICGDPTYLPEGKLGVTQTLPVDAPPLCLVAQRLTFTHPISNARVTFEVDWPDWCQADKGSR